MKIVKKTNGNIVILNTDATVKAVIQQTGVQMLLEGDDIKIIQNGYPIAYIKASEVTHTQIEPAAQVAFNGDNSALMTLLAEDFFVLATATDTGGFVETEIDVTSSEILAMGTTPVELLPAPGTGKYYNIESLIVEYNAGTTSYTYVAPEDMLWIYGDTTTYLTTDIGQTLTDSFAISSVQAANNVFNTGANNYTTYETLNRPVSLSTWTTTDWTLGDGTLKIKIKYKVETFG